MTHWGWYWKVKKRHKPKALCHWGSFLEIDSFSMFKNKESVRLVKESKERISFIVPRYNLTATLGDDNSLSVHFNGQIYIIPVEAKPCHYGGFYYFFHCPECGARMRKLYCIKGIYACRKCAHLGYYSQRLRPSERNARMTYGIGDYLKDRGGSLEQKPPWMKQTTFQKIRRKYVKYDEKRFYAGNKEVLEWYGPRAERYLESSYLLFVSLPDAYVERLEHPFDRDCSQKPFSEEQPVLFSLSNIFTKRR